MALYYSRENRSKQDEENMKFKAVPTPPGETILPPHLQKFQEAQRKDRLETTPAATEQESPKKVAEARPTEMTVEQKDGITAQIFEGDQPHIKSIKDKLAGLLAAGEAQIDIGGTPVSVAELNRKVNLVEDYINVIEKNKLMAYFKQTGTKDAQLAPQLSIKEYLNQLHFPEGTTAHGTQSPRDCMEKAMNKALDEARDYLEPKVAKPRDSVDHEFPTVQ